METINYETAVALQPEKLRCLVENLGQSIGTIDQKWSPGETVGVVAMGASSHSAIALVTALQQRGIRAVNLTASDLELTPMGFQPADHYVLVSESGRSPEPIQASRRLTSGQRIGITNVTDSPFAGVVDSLLSLGDFDDSAVYTVGYTATLVAYSMLVAGLVADSDAPTAQLYSAAEIPGLVDKSLIQYAGQAARIGEALAGIRAVDFVGRGFSFATASEGALMFREALQVPTGAFDTYQYLHGPMEPLAGGLGLIVFGDERELPLVDSILGSGAMVVLITAASEDDFPQPKHANLTVVRIPGDITDFARAIVEIVIVQLIVGACARKTGRTIEGFRYHQEDTKLREQCAAN